MMGGDRQLETQISGAIETLNNREIESFYQVNIILTPA
jgi:hypothetical protein